MTYNVFRSLGGYFVAYCTSTKRASPALEANALTMRPRCPAARSAFKHQISSLLKSMIIHDPSGDFSAFRRLSASAPDRDSF
jgi:hypothetical protein